MLVSNKKRNKLLIHKTWMNLKIYPELKKPDMSTYYGFHLYKVLEKTKVIFSTILHAIFSQYAWNTSEFEIAKENYLIRT